MKMAWFLVLNLLFALRSSYTLCILFMKFSYSVESGAEELSDNWFEFILAISCLLGLESSLIRPFLLLLSLPNTFSFLMVPRVGLSISNCWLSSPALMSDSSDFSSSRIFYRSILHSCSTCTSNLGSRMRYKRLDIYGFGRV